MKPVFAQAQQPELVEPVRELHPRGPGGHDLGAAVRVQEVGAAEVVGVRATVVAVADAAHGAGRDRMEATP